MIRTVEFADWHDFKSGFRDELGSGRPIIQRYVFRGQANASWGIMSSFDRSIPAHLTDREREYTKFLSFFRLLNERVGTDLSSLGDLDLAGIAQHYGMPTRLIDWSRSPYVAAYFAFYYCRLSDDSDPNVAIWAIDTVEFERAVDKRKFQICNTKPYRNYRINRQAGKFISACGAESSLSGYISGLRSDCPLLIKFVIPVEESAEALNDLILMGLSPADIYPDFEGIANYVKLRMRFDGYSV